MTASPRTAAISTLLFWAVREGLAMGISKTTFASALLLSSLIVIISGPARAYDFSKPLSCAIVYRGGVMWTWADVSNGRAIELSKKSDLS